MVGAGVIVPDITVVSDFYCNDVDDLTSLEGSPEHMLGNFACADNRMRTPCVSKEKQQLTMTLAFMHLGYR